MNIKPDDLVLEVGSGDKPYPRADVLLDKLPDDSSEREARKELVIDRPLVIGDIEALPFADKSFDYIIASHVLEHAQNPAKFLEELSRVGRRGYIETPLPLRERVFDWPFHRWYVYLESKGLVLVRKTAKSKKFSAGMNCDKREKLHHLDGKSLLNLGFEWKDKIDYEIKPSEPSGFLEKLDQKLAGFFLIGAKGEGKSINKWLRDNLFKIKFGLEKKFQFWRRRKKLDLFSLIVCPKCKGKLHKLEKTLKCLHCGRIYSFYRDAIPCLRL